MKCGTVGLYANRRCYSHFDESTSVASFKKVLENWFIPCVKYVKYVFYNLYRYDTMFDQCRVWYRMNVQVMHSLWLYIMHPLLLLSTPYHCVLNVQIKNTTLNIFTQKIDITTHSQTEEARTFTMLRALVCSLCYPKPCYYMWLSCCRGDRYYPTNEYNNIDVRTSSGYIIGNYSNLVCRPIYAVSRRLWCHVYRL